MTTMYAVPAWATPLVRPALCECGRAGVATFPIGVITGGDKIGELNSSGKVRQQKVRAETLVVCHACLVMERYQRRELAYRLAEEWESALRREIAPLPVIERVPKRGKKPRLKAAQTRIERLARRQPTLTAKAVATKTIPKHRARLALLLMEAEGLLSIESTAAGVVYRA